MSIGQESVKFYSYRIALWHSIPIYKKQQHKFADTRDTHLNLSIETETPPRTSIPISPITFRNNTGSTSTTDDVWNDSNNADSFTNTGGFFTTTETATTPLTSPQSKNKLKATLSAQANQPSGASLSEIGEVVEQKLDSKLAAFLVKHILFMLS